MINRKDDARYRHRCTSHVRGFLQLSFVSGAFSHLHRGGLQSQSCLPQALRLAPGLARGAGQFRQTWGLVGSLTAETSRPFVGSEDLALDKWLLAAAFSGRRQRGLPSLIEDVNTHNEYRSINLPSSSSRCALCAT